MDLGAASEEHTHTPVSGSTNWFHKLLHTAYVIATLLRSERQPLPVGGLVQHLVDRYIQRLLQKQLCTQAT